MCVTGVDPDADVCEKTEPRVRGAARREGGVRGPRLLSAALARAPPIKAAEAVASSRIRRSLAEPVGRILSHSRRTAMAAKIFVLFACIALVSTASLPVYDPHSLFYF